MIYKPSLTLAATMVAASIARQAAAKERLNFA